VRIHKISVTLKLGVDSVDLNLAELQFILRCMYFTKFSYHINACNVKSNDGDK
jgi:hypothetical protein